jgi:hypothetical protein
MNDNRDDPTGPCPHYLRLGPEQRRAKIHCIWTAGHKGPCAARYHDTTPPSDLTWQPQDTK